MFVNLFEHSTSDEQFTEMLGKIVADAEASGKVRFEQGIGGPALNLTGHKDAELQSIVMALAWAAKQLEDREEEMLSSLGKSLTKCGQVVLMHLQRKMK